MSAATRLRAGAHLLAGGVCAFALISLWVQAEGWAPVPEPIWHWAIPQCAVALLLTALAVLAYGRWGPRAGFLAVATAAWLWDAVAMTQLGWERISPTIILATVLASSLLLAWRWRSLSATLTAGTGLLGLVTVLQFLLAGFWSPLGPNRPTLHPATAVCLLALSLGWLTMEPHRRPASLLFERGSAGWLARRLLPLALVFPVLLAWLRSEHRAAHTVGTLVCLVLIIALTFIVFLTLVWKAATALDRLDISRAALQAHAHEINDLYNNAPCGYHSLDAEGRYARVNDTELRWLGYQREELVGRMLLRDLLPPGSRERFDRYFSSLVQFDVVHDLELDMLRKDGSTLTVVANATAMRDEHGNFCRSRTTLYDATERKRAEAALRAAEERLRLVLDSTGEGILVVDLDGVCTLCNTASLRLLGYGAAAELIGQPMHALIHHSRADGSPYPRESCRGLDAIRRGVALEADDEVFWRADGSSIPVEYRSYPVMGAGQAVGSVITFSDISARRQLESQVRHSQKMEAVGRLAAGVAHDFNNLLTVINGYSDLLLEANLEMTARAQVRSVRKAGERAAMLTNQLLAFSRQQVLEPRVLDLNQVVREVEPLLVGMLGGNVTLAAELAMDLRPVRADASQLDQVLMNLVVNASDAMPEGGHILIETANASVDETTTQPQAGLAPGEYVVLAVRDTGTGMRPETQAHIFEPFFTTKPQGQGTGLGLPTVFGIARQSGGTVTVESRWGQGTTMRVFLPVHGNSADAPRPFGRPIQEILEDN